MKTRSLISVALALCCLLFVASGSQVLANNRTDEFRVNDDTTGNDQLQPSIAAPHLVVWKDYRWGWPGLYGESWPAGGDFWIVRDWPWGDDVFTPVVSKKGTISNAEVVVWVEEREGDNDIYLSTPVRRPHQGCQSIKVNWDETTYDQRKPDVAQTPYIGHFFSWIVVWEDNRGGNYEIYGERYHWRCTPDGDFQVSPFVGAGVNKSNPAVAMNDSGSFVVVWEDDRDNGYIYAQRFNSECQPVGLLTQVNDYTAYQDGPPRFPKVAIDNFGNFVVVWVDSRDHQFLHLYDIYAQWYDSTGAAQGGNFRVNQHVACADLNPPDLAMDTYGSFVVVWRYGAYSGGGWYFDIYERKYNPRGVPLADNQRVNTDEGDASQTNPTVALDEADFWLDANIYFAWQDDRVPEMGWDIYAKIEEWRVRYIPGDANADGIVNVGDITHLNNYLYSGGPPPIPMNAGDANGDCVVNVGDVVYIVSYLYRGGPPPVPGCVE